MSVDWWVERTVFPSAPAAHARGGGFMCACHAREAGRRPAALDGPVPRLGQREGRAGRPACFSCLRLAIGTYVQGTYV
jgi:hypothetical protein